MDFEHPLTRVVWLTSCVSIAATYAASYVLLRGLGDGSLWWKLSTVITCGTLAGAVIPELVKIFTSMNSKHVAEVVTSSKEGGASLNILSGLVAGDFYAHWLGPTTTGFLRLPARGSSVGGRAPIIRPGRVAFCALWVCVL